MQQVQFSTKQSGTTFVFPPKLTRLTEYHPAASLRSVIGGSESPIRQPLLSLPLGNYPLARFLLLFCYLFFVSLYFSFLSSNVHSKSASSFDIFALLPSFSAISIYRSRIEPSQSPQNQSIDYLGNVVLGNDLFLVTVVSMTPCNAAPTQWVERSFVQLGTPALVTIV